ncbi:MAG: hypothetical protein EOP45_16720 [Sphingobacteriaceae bacterium]|nr:MAG: hypothetical protein EOP45_16720 [Sphingobacteriaceae bacterium]
MNLFTENSNKTNFTFGNTTSILFTWLLALLCTQFSYGQKIKLANTHNTATFSIRSGAGIKLSNVKKISRVTGVSLPGETLPNPNKTAEKYDVAGTDLGIMWALDKSRIGIFFGFAGTGNGQCK